jgi:toxin ParE1/3/4
MPSKEIGYHEKAVSEAEAALDWYLERSPPAAVGFVAELIQALDSIAAAPKRWPPGPHGTRRFLLRRYPFAIVYRELPSFIQVLAVAHGRRRPGYWKERL